MLLQRPTIPTVNPGCMEQPALPTTPSGLPSKPLSRLEPKLQRELVMLSRVTLPSPGHLCITQKHLPRPASAFEGYAVQELRPTERAETSPSRAQFGPGQLPPALPVTAPFAKSPSTDRAAFSITRSITIDPQD